MHDTQASRFESIVEFPNPDAKKRYGRLVGLDELKERLGKEARILLNPSVLKDWSQKHHGREISLVQKYAERSPLFIFAGDVGTGKTELAESFGDQVARDENIAISLYRLSLGARGSGVVGEMTRLVSGAFDEVIRTAKQFSSKDGAKHRSGVILLIDEADALAQSRDLGQMHHEDRAGVNALIRGVSSLATGDLPALVVMCTNRMSALDPAVRRRAADIFEFTRPNQTQRISLLRDALVDVDFTDKDIEKLAKLTGSNGRGVGFTYSDLSQRLLPQLVLDAFPDRPIDVDRAMEIAKEMLPTAPFQDKNDE